MRRLLLLLALAPAGCAAPGCGNPYVLDFVDAADARSDVFHLGLVRGSVRTDPGPLPGVAQCSIWERARPVAGGAPDRPPGQAPGQPTVLLRAQRYTVTKVDDGWRVGGLGF